MQQTTYYKLSEPEYGENIDVALINGNMDVIDTALHRARTRTTDVYSEQASYKIGDFVIYQDTLYRCTADTSGVWDISKWQATTIADAFEPKHTWELLDTITTTTGQIVIDKDIPDGTTSIFIRMFEKAGTTENAGHVYVAVRFEAAPTTSVTTAFFTNMITNADRYATHDLVMDGNRVQALFSPPVNSSTTNANVNQRYAYNFFNQGQIKKVLIIGQNSVPHNAGSTFEIYIRR